MSGLNYYELLGVDATATESEIRRAYLRLSLQYHPDKRRSSTSHGDDAFHSIQEAYETLSCPEKRCLYDFVGAFAVLADATTSTSLNLAPPAAGDLCQPSRVQRPVSLRSSGSLGEMLHSWAPSPSPSASRSSPSPSSDTCLSTSPGSRGMPNSHAGLRHKRSSPDDIMWSGVSALNDVPLPSGGEDQPGTAAWMPTVAGGSGSSGLQHFNVAAATTFGQHAVHSGPAQAAAGPSSPSGSLLGKRRSPSSDQTGPPVRDPMRRAPQTVGRPCAPQDFQTHQPSAPEPAPSQLPSFGALAPLAPRLGLDPHRGADAMATTAARGVLSGTLRDHSADVHHRLMLTLEEMYSGCVKQLRLHRRVYRRPLSMLLLHHHEALGGPAAPGEAWPAASVSLRAAGFCSGGGGGPGGTGLGPSLVVDSVEELFRVEVQPGWREGTKVTFQGKGDELPCGGAGDMVLVVAQAAHCRFERRGNDLHTVVEVPLVDALAGGHAVLSTLDGRSLMLALGPSCLQPFSERVVRGEGMPIPPSRARARTAAAAATTAATAAAAAVATVAEFGSGSGSGSGPALPPGWSRGDLHVRFRVAFPADLTPEQKAELRGALDGSGGSAAQVADA